MEEERVGAVVVDALLEGAEALRTLMSCCGSANGGEALALLVRRLLLPDEGEGLVICNVSTVCPSRFVLMVNELVIQLDCRPVHYLRR